MYKKYGKMVGVLVAMGLVAYLFVAGCAPAPAAPAVEETAPVAEAPPAEAPPTPEPYRIGWVVKTLDNPYWVSADKYGKLAAEALGVRLWAYSVGGENLIANQIAIMEDLIQLGMDAIVVSPVDSKGIIPAIEAANAANIPVVVIDTAADGGKIETFVAIDNVKAAALAAEAAVKLLDGKGKIAILEGILAQSTGRERLEGWRSVIDKYPDIEVVASLPGEWDKATAMAVTEDILTAHPDVELIAACNDMMALGAVEAIRAAGKTGEIYVLGFDGVREALEAIKEGTMTGTSNQNPEIMAVWGMMAAVKVLEGEKLPERIETPRAYIDKTNVDEYLKPSPPVEVYMDMFPIK